MTDDATADSVERLIAARIPELEGQRVVPAEVFVQVMQVVDAMMDRIAAIEARLDERAG
jgi:hypothetical protein